MQNLRNTIFIIFVILFAFSSCVSTSTTKAFRAKNVESLTKHMGEPTEIIDNGKLGVVWEYSEPNGAYSKFFINKKNKIYDSETSYVLKRLSSWLVVTITVVVGGAVGYLAGGG